MERDEGWSCLTWWTWQHRYTWINTLHVILYLLTMDCTEEVWLWHNPPIKYIHSPTRHLQAKGFLLYRQRLSHEWFLSTKVRVLSVIKYYFMYLLVYLLGIMPFWTSILQIFVVQSQFKFWPECFEFKYFFLQWLWSSCIQISEWK